MEWKENEKKEREDKKTVVNEGKRWERKGREDQSVSVYKYEFNVTSVLRWSVSFMNNLYSYKTDPIKPPFLCFSFSVLSSLSGNLSRPIFPSPAYWC